MFSFELPQTQKITQTCRDVALACLCGTAASSLHNEAIYTHTQCRRSGDEQLPENLHQTKLHHRKEFVAASAADVFLLVDL